MAAINDSDSVKSFLEFGNYPMFQLTICLLTNRLKASFPRREILGVERQRETGWNRASYTASCK